MSRADSRPPVPPITSPGGAWPGPGGAGPAPGAGGPGGGAPGPLNPFAPPYAPWNNIVPDFGPWISPTDTDDDGKLNWNTKDFLQHLSWKADTNMLRHEWMSAENIALWPREYTDLFELFTASD